jgi:hypothetical protein
MAAVAKRSSNRFVHVAGDAHQADRITEVVLQCPGDAAAQIGPSGLAGSAAGSGADQGFSGHLDQILPLHQRTKSQLPRPTVLQDKNHKAIAAIVAGRRENAKA